MKSSTIKLGLPVLLMILLLSGTFVWGQLGTSTIRGTITDSSGAALPGATVTITNLQTNLSRTLTTGPAGTYSFESILPGEYKVEMEAKGFRKSVAPRVQALVGSIAEVSQSLKVGEVKETVVVETTASDIQVNTQDATLGNTFANREINQLPMRDRDVLSLLTLQPGVTQDGYVAGARSDQSNITLDGVDINDAQSNAIDGPVAEIERGSYPGVSRRNDQFQCQRGPLFRRPDQPRQQDRHEQLAWGNVRVVSQYPGQGQRLV